MSGRKTEYAVDNSAILYLAQMGADHTNVYRFTVQLTRDICPEVLQQAVDRVSDRFPTIFAGFRPGFFDYTLVPAAQPPRVQQDQDLLRTMTREEIRTCAYRVLYRENRISIEAFHALSDGYGAVMTLRALVAEYLFLLHGVDTPERQELLEKGEPDWQTELEDSYLDYAAQTPSGTTGRYSYQLPGEDRDGRSRAVLEAFSTRSLLTAAKNRGVSLTALISWSMAEAIMTIQQRRGKPGREKPVQIMVPVDLRRLFPSRTLRNFILYALPGLDPGDMVLAEDVRLQRIHQQLLQQVQRERLGGQIARNVRLQQSVLYRAVPLFLKCAAMRLAYRFFGESNSSITLTNLGAVSVSEEMADHVRSIQVYLTPRRHSPYNCAVISFGDQTYISVTRFGLHPELEDLFFRNLRSLIQE